MQSWLELYLLAVQMSDAGATPKAIVDTQQSASYLKAAGYWLNAWQGRNYIAKGLTLLSKIHKLGIKRYTSSTDIEALGSQRLEGLTFQSSGRTVELKGETVLAHIGVIPNVQLTRAMGLEHVWDSLQVCWKPKLDSNNMSSRYGVFVVGDSGGIGGAIVAELQGELVAQNTLQDHELNGNLITKNNDNPIKAIINKELSVRPFLDALYTPPKQALTPSDQTIVCRCEEVTAKQILDHVDQGACGINQIKTFTRCGMGPCQGRHCGSTVAHIISDKVGISMEKVGYYRLRNPIKPLKLGELASLTPAKSSFIKNITKEILNMNKIQRLHTNQRMSKIVTHNDTIYLCGQVGVRGTSVTEQTREALTRVENLLVEAESDCQHVLQVTVWLADISDFNEMNAIWDEWFDEGFAPARACGEAKLASPELKVELLVTAARKTNI